MEKSTYSIDIDPQSDALIRLNAIDAMTCMLTTYFEDFEGDRPADKYFYDYLYLMGDQIDMIRQNLKKIFLEGTPSDSSNPPPNKTA